jgi:hypothetical protein
MSEAISHTGADGINRQWMTWGATGVVLAALVGILFNVNVAPGDNGGLKDYLVTLVGLVVIGAVLYLFVFPRIASPATGALVAGIVAVVLLIAFWSGAPALLAPAAYAYFRREPAAVGAKVGVGLAAVALVVDVIAGISNAF